MSLCDIYLFSSNPYMLVFLIIAVPLFFLNLLELFPNRKHIVERSTQLDDLMLIKFPFTFGKIIIILLCFALSTIILFANNQFAIMLGCEDIRVMPDGTYCYYVLATNEKDKTYTLPAKINKDGQLYRIENVYFKNGGFLYLECDSFAYDDKEYALDQNENGWHFKLTSNKTTHPKVKETDYSKPSKLIFNFALSIMLLLCAALNIWHWLKFRKLLTIKRRPAL